MVKKAFLSLAFAGCIGVAPTLVKAQGEGPVVVYDQRDGRGGGQAFNNGTFRSDRGQLGSLRNDAASSVFVANGYRVRLCENEGRDGEGRCEEWGPGTHNLRYQNAASYIKVTGSGWRGGGYGGNNNGGYNNGGNNNGGYNNGGNNNGGYNNGGNNNGGYGGNVRNNGVTVFAERDFRGRDFFFGVGHYLSGSGQFGGLQNDQASSVIVPRGYKVKFCENEGNDARGSGRCEEYTEGRYNLRYNDEASFVEVQRSNSPWGNWGGYNGNGNNGNGNNGNGNYGNNGGPRGGDSVVLYADRDEGGTEQVFGIGTFRNDLRQLGSLRNDDAESVYVPRGYHVKLCDGEGGGVGLGPCEEYGPGTFNLRYRNKTSYIVVTRGR